MSQELTTEQIQQSLQGISVPAQPQIMVDLQMEQYMPDPDLEVIAKLISQDPGLSGALLKIVNSPYYGLSNKNHRDPAGGEPVGQPFDHQPDQCAVDQGRAERRRDRHPQPILGHGAGRSDDMPDPGQARRCPGR